jgi:hypothetical protein
MRLEKSKFDDDHVMSIEGRGEAFRVARAIGLWRYSSIKLLANTMMGMQGGLDLRIDTVNLQTIERRMSPPSTEIRAYLGQAALHPAETVLQPVVEPAESASAA